MPPYAAPFIEVGTPVQWFPHADPNERPHGAKVLAVENATSLCLAVFPVHGQAAKVAAVRHLHDPHFQTCTQEYKNAHGAWGLIRSLMPRQERIEDDERRIIELHKEGKSAKEIGAGLGWSWQRVVAFLRKQELTS